MSGCRLIVVALTLLIAASTSAAPTATPEEKTSRRLPEVCFLLWEAGIGLRRDSLSELCNTPLSPASTFKIPHALAALDAGVANVDEVFAYHGEATNFASWRRDQTLSSATRNSVVWVFQQLAVRLGMEREREYLQRFQYGNMNASSGLTTFWLGQSLRITPREQLMFLLRFYREELPVNKAAIKSVKQLLRQPHGAMVNAAGEFAFNPKWPAEVVVSAKSGGVTDDEGRGIRWLVGTVERGSRTFVFVSCVMGANDLPPDAAINLAATSLQAVLEW